MSAKRIRKSEKKGAWEMSLSSLLSIAGRGKRANGQPKFKEAETTICQMPHANMTRAWTCRLHLATSKRKKRSTWAGLTNIDIKVLDIDGSSKENSDEIME